MKVFSEGGLPIKAWVDGVELEEEARTQLIRVSKMPFVYKHVAVMPDVHAGKGSTVGSVIATNRAIVPATVGVDLGCGMAWVRTTLTASDLPESLSALRSDIEAAVPHGRTDNGGPNDRGAWGSPPDDVCRAWDAIEDEFMQINERLSRGRGAAPIKHLGTLGTGNHFIEIVIDEEDRVGVMVHSGSRGIGNRIGQTYIEAAQKEMERYYISLEDKELSYLVEGTPLFSEYIRAVGWAQEFARANREVMLSRTLAALAKHTKPFKVERDGAVNCHHNYVERENHYGQNVLVTRKGAVRARKGELGIIPGSMGAKSYIVRGKGNPESFCSCSHGAGRRMSRTEARKRFTLADHELATKGVECRKDEDVIDETPAAYKDIDAVMAAQSDLVEIVHTLKQVLCVKG